jgi:hypothetical protein
MLDGDLIGHLEGQPEVIRYRSNTLTEGINLKSVRQIFC